MPSKAPAAPPLWALRQAISPGRARLLSGITLVVLFGAWCVASYVTTAGPNGPTPLVPTYFLPAPDEVLKGLLVLFFDQDLTHHVLASVWRVTQALGLSLAIALPLGIGMGSFDALNRLLDPIFAPLRYLPITAFIPLLILWFGIDEREKIAFLFLGTFVYLVPLVVDAIRSVPEELVQTAFTLGATKAQVIRTVLVPAALPQIFDGFRNMNAIAWTYIILAELVNTQHGLGAIFEVAKRVNKPQWTFAGVIVVGVIGLGSDMAIRGVNRLLFSWREADA